MISLNYLSYLVFSILEKLNFSPLLSFFYYKMNGMEEIFTINIYSFSLDLNVVTCLDNFCPPQTVKYL